MNRSHGEKSFFPGALFSFVILLSSSIAAAKAPAEAPHFSGTELLTMCTSAYDTDYGTCAGYINAISDILLHESVADQRACKHDKVRSQQGIDIFRSYAEVFPEMLKEEASVAVAAAFARAFPCNLQ